MRFINRKCMPFSYNSLYSSTVNGNSEIHLGRQQKIYKSQIFQLSTNANNSSSSTTPSSTKPKDQKYVKKDIIEEEQKSNPPSSTSKILYKSDASKSFFPRALLSLSTIHTGYWTWYVTDFTPFVQEQVLSSAAKAVTDVASSTSYIDNTVGYVGLGLAIFMSTGSLIYPTSVVQEIQLVTSNHRTGNSSNDKNMDTNTTGTTKMTKPLSTISSSSSPSLQIRTYSLPFITPSTKTINYKLGDLIIDSPNDVKKIITKYGGDISQYDGYLPLHAEGRYINLLLQLSDPKKNKNDGDTVNGNSSEIYDSETLFKSLVSPKLHGVIGSHGDQNESKTGELNNSKNDRGKRNSHILLKKQKRKERQLLRRR